MEEELDSAFEFLLKENNEYEIYIPKTLEARLKALERWNLTVLVDTFWDKPMGSNRTDKHRMFYEYCIHDRMAPFERRKELYWEEMPSHITNYVDALYYATEKAFKLCPRL